MFGVWPVRQLVPKTMPVPGGSRMDPTPVMGPVHRVAWLFPNLHALEWA